MKHDDRAMAFPFTQNWHYIVPSSIRQAEPISTRLASLAMDIDDIDYAYHIAYPEIIWGIFRVRIMARYHESDLEIKPYRKSV